MAKTHTFNLNDVLIYIILPIAIFWLLARFGFLSIIDSLAISVLVILAIYFVVKYLFKKKIISFGN